MKNQDGDRQSELVARLERGERLEVQELLDLMDALLTKHTPRQGAEPDIKGL